MKQFFGKYRGKVTGNKDPMHLGRIQVSVPAVLGESRSSWAMPCVPYAGPKIGFFAIPPEGANIWVEFEGGDPDYPIWSGCFWGKDENPIKAVEPAKVQVFKTDGIAITLSNQDKNKRLTVEVEKPVVEKPLKLILNEKGIEINNDGKVSGKFTTETIEFTNESAVIILAKDSITIQSQKDTVDVKLTSDSIELRNGSSTAKLASESVHIDQKTATLKLSSSGIEISNKPATIKLSSSGVEVGNAPATVKVAPSGIELSNGAANIKLSPAIVNINNGALEVI
jgi:uncharacterized protein involved in type VI secretion and phage assembly